MAKLRIGSGVQIEAQLPKEDQVSDAPSGLDVMALVQKTIDALPKPEPIKEAVIPQNDIDLTGLASHQDVAMINLNMLNIESRVDILSLDLDELQSKVDKLDQDDVFVIPEIKSITNIQDIGQEYRDEIEDRLHQQYKSLRKQMKDELFKVQKINIILSSVLVIIFLLHLM